MGPAPLCGTIWLQTKAREGWRVAGMKRRKGRRARAALAMLALVLCAAAVGMWRQWPSVPSELVVAGTEDGSYDWDEASAPNYYVLAGSARIEPELSPGEVTYEPLDALGRAQGVAACVDYELMEAGRSRERESMSDLEPSGWGTNDKAEIELPNGKVYHGYFWNRSHLLAKSLGGEEIIENIVCGTRMQNVGANVNGSEGGMAYGESLARDWLEQHADGCVWYCARPVYEGNEPVCRAVVVDIRASDGSIDCELVVYNAAKGHEIDYATGAYSSR